MNLSCRPFCQSSSVSVSITPPGAEPALLTKMSMRPNCRCALSTKFFASASFVRSAATANTLRPLARWISSAALSSTSLRRAQIATSQPSRTRASAMPLPMPSLPPVTQANLPFICRSIATSPRLANAILRELPAGSRLVNRRCENLHGGSRYPGSAGRARSGLCLLRGGAACERHRDAESPLLGEPADGALRRARAAVQPRGDRRLPAPARADRPAPRAAQYAPHHVWPGLRRRQHRIPAARVESHRPAEPDLGAHGRRLEDRRCACLLPRRVANGRDRSERRTAW